MSTAGDSYRRIARMTRRVWRSYTPVIASCALAMNGALRAQAARPLDVDDLLSAPAIVVTSGTPLTLSADGEYLAVTLRDRRRVQPGPIANTALATPKGTLVAYLGTDVWVVRVRDGQMTRVSGGQGANWGPSWSPDGRTLAFYSDRDGAVRVWCWDAASGTVKRVTEAPAQTLYGAAPIQWFPDGNRMLVPLLPSEMAAWDLIAPDASEASSVPENEAGVIIYSEGGTSAEASRRRFSRQPVVEWVMTNRGLADLAIVEVATGTVTRLTSGERPAAYWLSPAGEQVAYTTLDTAATDERRLDLIVTSIGQHATRTTISGISQSLGFNVSWSPDGSALAYISSEGQSVGDLFVIGAHGGKPRRITPDLHPPLRTPALQGPQWSADSRNVFLLGHDTLWQADVSKGGLRAVARVSGRNLVGIVGSRRSASVWSPDGGGSLLIETRDPESMRVGMARVDVRTGQADMIVDEDRAYGPAIMMDAVRNTVAYVSEGAGSPPEIWVATNAFQRRRQLTSLSPTLNGYKFGKSRLIHWLSADGQRLTGVLLLPSEYREGVRYPTIIALYGGYRPASTVNNFGLASPATDGLNLQLLSTRGYAVLVPDAPIVGTSPMRELSATVLPGVNRIIELGIADPERLGITGHSFGGYSALALATQTRRFKAVVSRGGFSDLVAYALNLDAFGQSWALYNTEHGPQAMGGNLWERRSAFIANSPLHHLDELHAPVLLIHSTTDWAVPVHLADETFVALRRLGRRVSYAKYVGEEHEERFWRYANARDMLYRILSWFDENLAVPTPGTSASLTR